MPNLKQAHQNKRKLWFTVRFIITGKWFHFHHSAAPCWNGNSHIWFIKKVIYHLEITPVIWRVPTFSTIHAVTMIFITDLSKLMDFIYSQYQQTTKLGKKCPDGQVYAESCSVRLSSLYSSSFLRLSSFQANFLCGSSSSLRHFCCGPIAAALGSCLCLAWLFSMFFSISSCAVWRSRLREVTCLFLFVICLPETSFFYPSLLEQQFCSTGSW